MDDLHLNISFNNTYIFDFIDSKTDIKTKTIKTHNIVLDGFWNNFNIGAYKKTSDYYQKSLFDSLRLNVGKGNRPPSPADNRLVYKLWDFSVKTRDYKTNKNTNTYTHILTYEIPATLDYEDSFSEVGLSYFGRGVGSASSMTDIFVTRALLQDAEGNPMTVEKKSSEKIIVTVLLEITMASSLRDFKFLDPEDNGILSWGSGTPVLFMHDPPDQFQILGLAQPDQLVRFDVIENTFELANRYIDCKDGISLVQAAWGPKEHYYDIDGYHVSYSNLLMNTSLEDPLYINAFAIPGLGSVRLPNFEVYPPQIMKNLNIGTGDGLATEFKCPLNLFMRNTDKIYKNGVLLKRGVDYTIDNENNQDMLLEISLGNLATISGGVKIYKNSLKWGNYEPIFKKTLKNSFTSISSGDKYPITFTYCFNKENPLFFTCQEPQKCNTLRIPSWFPIGIYTLSYSDNGEEYTKCLEINKEVEKELMTAHSEDITAKYWKIETNYEGTFFFERNNESNLLSKQDHAFLGYVGKPILFKTPPKNGDSLILEAQIDRPYLRGGYLDEMAASFSIIL